MTLNAEDVKTLFASPEFKEAMREYLKENLRVEVKVDHGRDIYSRDNEVSVEVELSLADDQPAQWSHRTSSFSSSSGSVTVHPRESGYY
jgi:hypothetical protein